MTWVSDNRALRFSNKWVDIPSKFEAASYESAGWFRGAAKLRGRVLLLLFHQTLLLSQLEDTVEIGHISDARPVGCRFLPPFGLDSEALSEEADEDP
jgi:hypothetical protein